jgi:hypothetical protein
MGADRCMGPLIPSLSMGPQTHYWGEAGTTVVVVVVVVMMVHVAIRKDGR